MDETVSGIIKARQPAFRAYPQLAFSVAIELNDDITAQRGRVVRVMQIGRETVAVELVKSVFGSYPHVAVLVLADVIDESARQTFRRVEIFRRAK